MNGKQAKRLRSAARSLATTTTPTHFTGESRPVFGKTGQVVWFTGDVTLNPGTFRHWYKQIKKSYKAQGSDLKKQLFVKYLHRGIPHHGN